MTELEQWSVELLAKRPDFKGVDVRDMELVISAAEMMRHQCAKEAAHLFDAYAGPSRHMSAVTFEAAMHQVGLKKVSS